MNLRVSLEWIGAVSILVGTTLTALTIPFWNLFFNIVGAAIWVGISLYTKQYSLTLLNGVTIAVCVAGISFLF